MAYVIHTSRVHRASEGVMGSQGALSAHASAVIGAYGLTAEDRVLHFASPGFDVALEEVVPTLLVGATLVIRSEDETGSVQAFLDFVERHAVTVLNLPASFWHVLVEEMQARTAASALRASGGDGQRADHRKRAGRLAADCAALCLDERLWPDRGDDHLHDLYPSPRRRGWTRRKMCRSGALWPMPAPMFWPLMAVWRRWGRKGNLHIGGPAVTLGYLNQPEITASVFLPDPFEGGGCIARGIGRSGARMASFCSWDGGIGRSNCAGCALIWAMWNGLWAG